VTPTSDADRVLDVLRAALDLEPTERQSFLAKECATEPEVRAEVERLLAEEPDAADFEERAQEAFGQISVTMGSDSSHPTEVAPESVEQASLPSESGERYTFEEKIAEGGMGVVLRVVDNKLGRSLAMKVVKGTGSAESGGTGTSVSSAELSRFLAEAQVTSQIDHPGVVPVHDLGLDAESRAYLGPRGRSVSGRDPVAVRSTHLDSPGQGIRCSGWIHLRAVRSRVVRRRRGIVPGDEPR